MDGLRAALRRGVPEPVYLVEGPEPLLAEEAVTAIVEAAVPEAGRDFNVNVYSGDDEAAREFLAQATSFPFLAERRAVVVRRFDKMSFAEKRAEKALLDYLQQPVPSTVLVLVAHKLDRRRSLTQAIVKAATAVSADTPRDDALPAWVARRFAAVGLEAEPRACARLVELVGSSLLDLRNEVDKVATRFAAAGRVDEDAVVQTVGRYREEEIWAIQRDFRPGNVAGFLQALGRVLEARDEPIAVSGVLARHVNTLLRIKLLQQQGVRGRREIAQRTGQNEYFIESKIRQAQDFTSKQLVLWLQNLQRADAQMKSSGLPQRWILERALVHSFHGRALA